MNYIKLQDNIITHFKNTQPRDRLRKRSPTDKRLEKESLYVEVHHIIPRSLGGTDEESNLVTVLPEEHIFLHMLRYKIYEKREDALAIRFMLNGYTTQERFEST